MCARVLVSVCVCVCVKPLCMCVCCVCVCVLSDVQHPGSARPTRPSSTLTWRLMIAKLPLMVTPPSKQPRAELAESGQKKGDEKRPEAEDVQMALMRL